MSEADEMVTWFAQGGPYPALIVVWAVLSAITFGVKALLHTKSLSES